MWKFGRSIDRTYSGSKFLGLCGSSGPPTYGVRLPADLGHPLRIASGIHVVGYAPYSVIWDRRKSHPQENENTGGNGIIASIKLVNWQVFRLRIPFSTS